jgi:hypothetical protein
MNIFRTLLFFPSITFSLLSAEIFPWAFLYSIVGKFRSYKKIDKKILPLIIGLLISLLYSLYLILLKDYESDFIRSIIAYLNPIFAYLAIMCCHKKELFILCKIVGKILLFFIFIGILQSVGIIKFLQPVFSFLIPRASTEALDIGGRGVTIFSSEPSRASYEIIFLYITWRYLQQKKAINKLFFDFFITLFILFILKASTGLMILIVFLLSEYRLKFVLSGLIVISVSLPLLMNTNSRAIYVMIKIFSGLSISNIFGYILSASGFRLVSIIAAYRYGILHPLGGGIGLWQISSVKALCETGIDSDSLYYFNKFGGFVPVRPTSYLSSMALDMGWMAIIIVFYLIKPLFKLISFDNALFSLIITFLFYIVVIGATGNPIPWICTAICYRVYKDRLNLCKIIE